MKQALLAYNRKHQTNYMTPSSHISIVEAARGFAALFVLLTHLITITHIDSSFGQDSIVFYICSFFKAYSHEMVILFFMLSGFSIHYASLDREFSKPNDYAKYFYARFKRIVPIFIIAVSLSLGVSYYLCSIGIKGHEYCNDLGFDRVLKTVFFMTDIAVRDGIIEPVISSNGPIWSLSYEIFYYLIYPFFSLACKRWGVVYVTIMSGVLSAVAIIFKLVGEHGHLQNVMALYSIWCAGALIAEFKRRDVSINLSSSLLALLTFSSLLFVMVLEKILWRSSDLYDQFVALVCFLMFLIFLTNNRQSLNRTKRISYLLVGAVIAATLFLLTYAWELSHRPEFLRGRILIFTALYVVFVLSKDVSNLTRQLLKPFTALGGISYAIYIIHYPIILFLLNNYSQLNIWMLIPFMLFVILLFALIIEKYLHPRVATFLDSKIYLRFNMLGLAK